MSRAPKIMDAVERQATQADAVKDPSQCVSQATKLANANTAYLSALQAGALQDATYKVKMTQLDADLKQAEARVAAMSRLMSSRAYQHVEELLANCNSLADAEKAKVYLIALRAVGEAAGRCIDSMAGISDAEARNWLAVAEREDARAKADAAEQSVARVTLGLVAKYKTASLVATDELEAIAASGNLGTFADESCGLPKYTSD